MKTNLQMKHTVLLAVGTAAVLLVAPTVAPAQETSARELKTKRAETDQTETKPTESLTTNHGLAVGDN
jgi:hypothetical protein